MGVTFMSYPFKMLKSKKALKRVKICNKINIIESASGGKNGF